MAAYRKQVYANVHVHSWPCYSCKLRWQMAEMKQLTIKKDCKIKITH